MNESNVCCWGGEFDKKVDVALRILFAPREGAEQPDLQNAQGCKSSSLPPQTFDNGTLVFDRW